MNSQAYIFYLTFASFLVQPALLLTTRNQLKFQQYSALAHCSHTVFKLLCREMSDVFIAPKLWLPYIPDFSHVDYRIWAVLWEWGCQQLSRYRWVEAMSDWHLIHHSTDQTIDQWRFKLRAWVRARCRQFEYNVYCCTALLVHVFSYCI